MMSTARYAADYGKDMSWAEIGTYSLASLAFNKYKDYIFSQTSSYIDRHKEELVSFSLSLLDDSFYSFSIEHPYIILASLVIPEIADKAMDLCHNHQYCESSLNYITNQSNNLYSLLNSSIPTNFFDDSIIEP